MKQPILETRGMIQPRVLEVRKGSSLSNFLEKCHNFAMNHMAADEFYYYCVQYVQARINLILNHKSREEYTDLLIAYRSELETLMSMLSSYQDKIQIIAMIGSLATESLSDMYPTKRINMIHWFDEVAYNDIASTFEEETILTLRHREINWLCALAAIDTNNECEPREQLYRCGACNIPKISTRERLISVLEYRNQDISWIPKLRVDLRRFWDRYDCWFDKLEKYREWTEEEELS